MYSFISFKYGLILEYSFIYLKYNLISGNYNLVISWYNITYLIFRSV